MGDEDPRKIISSALISSPKGVTLFRLLQDYREFTGQDVPYRQMGFPSVEQYLRSIPETCRITGSGRDALVIPVVNEQNKHINDMILKQKAPKTNPRSKARNIKRSRGIYDNSILYDSVSNYEPKPEIDFKLPDLTPNSHLRVLPPPPDYVRDMRRERCQPKTQTPVTVNKPQTFSQNSYNNSSSSGTASGQRFSQNNNPRSLETESDQTTSKVSFSLNSNKVLNSMHQDIAAALSEESDYDEYFNEVNFDDDDDDFYYKSDTESVDLSTSTRNLLVPITSETSIPMLDPDETSRPDHVSRVNDNVKEKLRQLISEHPDGIWCSKLLKLYRERFKQPLDPLDFGFSSVIQLCDDIPDVFHCIRPNRMDWKLYDVRKPVPDVHSMRDLSKYLQSLAIVNQNTENTEPPLPNDLVQLGNINPSYKYPETVLHPDETIERLKLPDDDQIDNFFEIIVAEVYDPSKFWIQLKGPNTFDAMEALMDSMQIYYMHNAGALQLNEFSVRIGLFVAALFLNQYHRAVVIKVFSDQTINVFYIDYGTVGEVSLRKTCLLHRDFAKLPQQAIRSRLDNIIPIEQNTMWSREASQFMLNMVMDKTLIGLIRRIDRDQQILHLIITDTTQDIDIHINDELVNNGYAALGNEAPLCSTSSAIVSNVHLYPSFEEIENYIYPNVGDINRLLKIGQTYETIFHGYFNHSSSDFSEHYQISNNGSRCGDESIQSEYQNRIEHENIHGLDLSAITSEESFIVESPLPSPPSPSPPPLHFQTETVEETLTPVKPVKSAAPPGFENITPNVDNFTQSTIHATPALPFTQTTSMPIIPLNPTPDLSQYMNQAALLNLAIVNPLVYNQMILQREIMLQQQREALLNQQRNALFQHQFEEFQRIITNKNNSASQGSSHVHADANSSSPKNMYDDLINSNDDDCSSNKSEQTTMRNVIELNLDHFNIHVIKLDNNYYIVSQEIISTLLKSDLSLKHWLHQNNLSFDTFPNKLINLANYEAVFNELVKFKIPGIKISNLGCNARVTLLHDVVDIIYKYGDINIIPELRNSIKNATESQYLWEVLHSSD